MTSPSSDDLQFDSADPDHQSSASGAACAVCGEEIQVYYYEAAGRTVCRHCKARDEAANGSASAGRGMAGAAVFGAMGALAGAAIYLGILFATGYEVGLVAILVGWIVGKAVFVGSGRTGGRRYQVLATVLTYFAISVSYVPQMIGQMLEESESRMAAIGDSLPEPAPAAAVEDDPAALADVEADRASVVDPGGIAAIAGLVGVTLAIAPVRVVVADFPGSLISVIIIGVGLLQAWQGAQRQRVAFTGPFKLGADAGGDPGAA
jgi:hypothetical protein